MLVAALHEQDPGKIANACEQARRAIQDRLLEISGDTDIRTPENEALDDVLRQLFIHEGRH